MITVNTYDEIQCSSYQGEAINTYHEKYFKRVYIPWLFTLSYGVIYAIDLFLYLAMIMIHI